MLASDRKRWARHPRSQQIDSAKFLATELANISRNHIPAWPIVPQRCTGLIIDLHSSSATKPSHFKTKGLATVLESLKVSTSSLLVDINANENLKLSARNLENHQYLPPEGVNVYDLLRFEHLVLTKDAAAAIVKRCSENG